MSETAAGRLSRREAWLALAAIFAAAGLCALLPAERVLQLRDLWQAALRPAQAAREQLAQTIERRFARPASELSASELQRRLEQSHRLAALALLTPPRECFPAKEPLLVADALPARVIGRQGRSYLEQLAKVDAGRAQQVLPGAWILDTSLPLVERGRESQLETGQLVLAGGLVWGRVEHVGPQASTVRCLTSAGYRAEVRLGQRDGESFRLGPSGILEGTGAELCRVRMVPTTAAVSVDDLVLTATGDELLPTPLIYGRITRCERPAGAVYWDLWLEPAAAAEPEQVAIVRVSLNTARVARADEEAPR